MNILSEVTFEQRSEQSESEERAGAKALRQGPADVV